MQVLAAPIQEYTDAAFRNAHSIAAGGIDEYYTPFIRLERGGLSKRASMDIAAENDRCGRLVPQLLAKDGEETGRLVEIVMDNGFRRVDFNFGCPFPKVVKSGYGAGILCSPEKIREVLSAALCYSGLKVSVKMRLGLVCNDGCLALLPLLNDFPLNRIVLHARTAVQQYDGLPDRDAFMRFAEGCCHPVFYNGDVRSRRDAAGMDKIMIGRGLLENPLLPVQLYGKQGSLRKFHDVYVEECCRLYNQPMLKLKLLWDYFMPALEKRLRKSIQKAVTLEEYMEFAELALDSGNF